MAITIDDFSKIWASASPLTPYSFSDDNYKQGWNFVGSTPPSRQMWDFLQKSNDEKLKFLLDNFDNYLSLSGGTMTGAIVGNPLTLSADDGNDSADLVLNPSGSATWNGKEVERVNASGTDYIRFESGLQICWGSVSSVTSTGVAFTYPVAFLDNKSVRVVPTSAYSNLVYCTNISSTGATAKYPSGTANAVYYLAIGYWK